MEPTDFGTHEYKMVRVDLRPARKKPSGCPTCGAASVGDDFAPPTDAEYAYAALKERELLFAGGWDYADESNAETVRFETLLSGQTPVDDLVFIVPLKRVK